MSIAPGALAVILVFAGLLGLAIGSFLNVVVHRVPAGIPLTRESRCPACGAPVRAWQNVPIASWLALRGRCASCRARIGTRYPLVEAATAVAFVAVTAWALTDPEALQGGVAWAALPVTAAYLNLAAIGIALALIDLDTRRLPNAIVLPAYAVGTALLTLACVLGSDWWALLRALIGMTALYLFYAILRLLRPGGMGGGDVKLAGVLGLHLAWIGWGALVVGAFAAFLLGGVYGIALIALRRAGRRSAIPFGPWMIAGAWVGVFAGEGVARAYAGLLGAA